MAFHNVRFPLDIALGARGGPQRLTDVVTLVSGAEERNSRWADSRRRFNAGYGVKSLADMQAVLAFFEERRGRFHSFLWRDGLDNSSAYLQNTITPYDQPIGEGDGIKTRFQLVKRYGENYDPYDRAVTKPVSASVRLALDGVEILPPDFTLDGLSGMVTFNVAPAPGVAITAGYEFDIPVRFDTDNLEIELAGFDAAVAPNIPIVEVLE
ncbi:MAG TPA: TIGR02217 family protein [Devosia sp.]|nr:TIGR02217 family protein [Devosia sp.]